MSLFSKPECKAALVVLGSLVAFIALATAWAQSPTGLHSNADLRPAAETDHTPRWKRNSQ